MKIFIALGSLLVVSLLVLLIGPSFVDWTAYRADFEREASRILGQHVEVKGRASARLLPFPSVTFTDVVVGDDPADPVLVMDGFRMDAELAPYLSGEIRIFHMRLDAPKLSVPIGEDGSLRWPTGATAVPEGFAVVLENIEIADGSATVEDRRSHHSVTLTNVDASFSAHSLHGPYNGSGTLWASGEPLRFTLSTGIGAADGTLPVRVSAESDRADAAFSLDAVASSLQGKPLLDGTLLVTSPLPKTAGEDEASDPSPLPAIHLESHLSVSASSIKASDLRAEVGGSEAPYVATGSASLDLGAIPHFDLQLDGQPIDVDELAPPATPSGEAPTVSARVEGIRTALSKIPNVSIPGRLRLSLPLMTIGDTTIRSVVFEGSPSAVGWSIETLSAELPGRTLLQASGLARTIDKPSFRGSLLLASRQPPAFIGWAGGTLDSSLARFDRAGFSANVDLTTDAQTFDDLEIDLAGQSLSGSIHRTVRPEGHVTAIDLRGDEVDLDPFAALAKAIVSDDDGMRDEERLDVQFEANPLSYAGFRAAHVEADFTLDRGLLDISSLDAGDFAGADVHAEGTIADLFGDPKPDLSLDVTADRPERFADFLQQQLPQSPLLASLHRTAETLGPLALRGTAASNMSSRVPVLAVELAGTAGGTDVEVKLALENGLAAARIDGTFGLDLRLANSDPAVLIDQFGLTALPVGAPGPLEFMLSASGHPGEPIAVSAAFRASETSLSANGTASLDGSGLRSAEVRLDVASDDLSPWLTTLGIAAGQPLSGLPVTTSAKLSYFGNDWTIDGLEGTLGETRVAADLSATAEEPITGAVRVSDLSSGWLATILTGTDASSAQDGEASSFQSPLLPSRAFRISLTADRVSGWTTPIVDLQADLEGDAAGLRATSLAAALGPGRIEGSAEIRNVAGFVSTKLDLRVRDFELAGEAEQGFLAGTLNASLQLQGGGQTRAELLASFDGGGSLTLADGRISGISDDLLTPILTAVDKEGFNLGSSSVAALVAEADRGATFPLGTITSDVTVGAGTLRIPPVTVRSGNSVLSGEGQVDLRDGSLDGLLQLTLAPAEDEAVDASAPSVAYRIGGTLEAPSLTANAESLTSYLSVRAYEREQARIEALQEDLRETVRLRREARLYRWREDIRRSIREKRLAAEEAARVEAERVAAQRAEEERQAREAELARIAAEAAARAAIAAKVEPSPSKPGDSADAGPPTSPRTLDFDPRVSPSAPPGPPPPNSGFGGLPGVVNPNAF